MAIPLVMSLAVAGCGTAHAPDTDPAPPDPALWRPIIDLAPLGVHGYGGDLQLSPDGRWAALTGLVHPGGPDATPARLVLVDLALGAARLVDEAMSIRVLHVAAGGGQVLYFRSDHSSYGLYLVEVTHDAEGAAVTHQAPALVGPSALSGALSPDRSRVAYANGDGIHIHHLATGRSETVVPDPYAGHPVWYPDGAHLFYFTDLGVGLGGGAGNLQGLGRLSLETGKTAPLAPGESGKYLHAEWIDPGRLLHLVRGFDDGYADLLVDVDTGQRWELGENARWRGRNGGVNRAARVFCRVEDADAGDGDPDGATDGGNPSVAATARVEVWSSNSLQPSGFSLPAWAGTVVDLDFSPDGMRLVAVAGGEDPQWDGVVPLTPVELIVADAVDGEPAHRLSHTPGPYSTPQWCDGGRRVVWVETVAGEPAAHGLRLVVATPPE